MLRLFFEIDDLVCAVCGHHAETHRLCPALDIEEAQRCVGAFASRKIKKPLKTLVKEIVAADDGHITIDLFLFHGIEDIADRAQAVIVRARAVV